VRTPLALACALLLAGCPGGEGGRPPTAGPPRGVWHQADAGESPGALARRYKVPLDDILESNGLERDSKLAAGQVVFIPGGAPQAPPAVVTADPGAPAASRPSVTPPAPPAGKLLWPVKGQVTSGFGARGKRPHEGIDIAAPEGEPVRAAADGTVIYAGSGVRGYGNLILLRHAGSLVTVYAHNRANLVKEKDAVKVGQVIAEVGRTGNASAAHLHFEVRRGEVPVDPLQQLTER
jgi:murein DD-endopeptidase MepM/ murein hydrolase activator NlpD